MKYSLTLKKSSVLLMIAIANICNTYTTCSKGCPFEYNRARYQCSFKILSFPELSRYTSNSVTPIYDLSESCICEMNCSDCEMDIPDTRICNFKDKVSKILKDTQE